MLPDGPAVLPQHIVPMIANGIDDTPCDDLLAQAYILRLTPLQVATKTQHLAGTNSAPSVLYFCIPIKKSFLTPFLMCSSETSRLLHDIRFVSQ